MNKLTQIGTQELSLVRRGANKQRFILYKSAEADEETTMLRTAQEIFKSLHDVASENEAEIDAVLKAHKVEGEPAIAMKSALRLVSGFRDELPAEAVAAVLKAGKFPFAPADEAADEEEDAADGGNPFAGKKKKKKETAAKADDSFSPEVRAMLAKSAADSAEAIRKADARAENAEKIAKGERDARLNREMIEKADKEMGSLVGTTPRDFGPILKALSESLDAKTYETVEGILKASSAMIAKSNALLEVGRNATGMGGGAMAKVTKMAEDLVKSSSVKLTKEAAVTKVLEENPALYSDYLAGN